MAHPDRYDTVRYPGNVYDFTHPDRLATIARLRGIAAPDVTTARVLELGCGDGMNLLGIACSLPGARILGIDACAAPLEATREAAVELGVENLELRGGDFTALDLGDESFDYIIAHGVLSWIPAPAGRALMRLIGERLSLNGVALTSFNALPGWRFHLLAREIIHATLGDAPRPDELAEARRMIHLFAHELGGAGEYGVVLGALTRYVDLCSDVSLFHDLLSPVLIPLGFADFADLYQPAGLQYVGDAVWADNVLSGYPAPFRRLLADAPDVVARERLVDAMRDSLFRRSVLARAGHELHWQPTPRDMDGLYVTLTSTYEATGSEGDTWRRSDGVVVTISDPTMVEAMRRLRQRAPDAMAIEGLFATPPAGQPAPLEAVHLLLLQAWAGGLVELLPRDRPHSAPAGALPRAAALARWQAATGASTVCNCCHDPIEIGPIDRVMLALCDGQHTREAIVDALVEAAGAGEFRVVYDGEPTDDPARCRHAITERLDERLAMMRSAGLLAVARTG